MGGHRDYKVSIRLTEDEMEEIKEFISRNPRFRKISELFRYAVMDYITRVYSGVEEIGEEYREGIHLKISLSPRMEKYIENFVDYGIFRSKQDAIRKIVLYIESKANRIVADFLKEEFETNYSILKKFERELRELEEEMKYYGGDRR